MDVQPSTVRRRRRKKGPFCLYIPKGTNRALTEVERMVCLEEFNCWLAGRELYQALADERAELRRSLVTSDEQLTVEAEDRRHRAEVNAIWLAAINRRRI
jgi:hypothetical protein